jgi:beta-N-acetylhexosaminidase
VRRVLAADRQEIWSLALVAGALALMASCASAQHVAVPARSRPSAHPVATSSTSSTNATLLRRAAMTAAGRATGTANRRLVSKLIVTRSGVPAVRKPPIVWDPIPFGPLRKAQMAAYAERHYGIDSYRLIDAHVIVIHYSETPDFQATYNTFAPDIPDPELHELPNVCAHFVIDQYGVIHQLVALGVMCRHTVGLNWTAIGIEHVGYSDQQVLDNPRQMAASLELVRWLRCRYQIAIADVIGHNESLTSPYHHENVPGLRTQTHADFNHADMQIYRSRLRVLGGCPTT